MLIHSNNNNDSCLLKINSSQIQKCINIIISFLPETYKKSLCQILRQKINKINSKKVLKFTNLKLKNEYSIDDKENIQMNNKVSLLYSDNQIKKNNTIPYSKSYNLNSTEKLKITPFSEGKSVVKNSKDFFFVVQSFKSVIEQFNLPSFSDMKIISKKNYLFYNILSENIFEITNIIDYNNKIIYDFKCMAINEIKKIIQKTFICNKENNFNLYIYGSFANGLNIETSDIDLLLTYNEKANCSQILIEELSEKLELSKIFKSVQKITHAHVPIIKLNYEISNNEMKKIGINDIHIDISFQNIFNKKIIPSLLIVNYIKRYLKIVPGGRNIILIIKKYLYNKGLNSYYNGGLSSFSIFLLVFSFFKYRFSLNIKIKNDNFGLFLFQFLEFYSQFDFTKFGIDLNRYNPFFTLIFYPMTISEYGGPVIIDPITHINIGSGSFRINEIKQSFNNFKNNLRELYEKDKNENDLFYLRIENYVNYCLNQNKKI